jgi:hypothetical protein
VDGRHASYHDVAFFDAEEEGGPPPAPPLLAFFFCFVAHTRSFLSKIYFSLLILLELLLILKHLSIFLFCFPITQRR